MLDRYKMENIKVRLISTGNDTLTLLFPVQTLKVRVNWLLCTNVTNVLPNGYWYSYRETSLKTQNIGNIQKQSKSSFNLVKP